jgi:hypothetical protein
MSTSNKFDWDLVDYGTVGWNGILQSFQVGVDKELKTLFTGTACTSNLDQDDVVYLDASGEYRRAKAAAGKLPAAGIAIASAASATQVIIRRLGPYTPGGAMSALSLGGKNGQRVYIDASVAGGWTLTKPAEHSQAIGRVMNSSTIFIWIEDPAEIFYGTTNPGSAATNVPDGTLFCVYTA